MRGHVSLALSSLLAVCSICAAACESGEKSSPSDDGSGGRDAVATTTSTVGGAGPVGPGGGGMGADGGQGGEGGPIGTGGQGGQGGDGGDGGGGGVLGTVALHEPFATDAGFTKTDLAGTPTTFFSNGANDYLGISDGMGGGDWDGDPDGPPSGVQPYIGFDGDFLTAQDLNGESGPEAIRLTWTNVNITGLNSLMFSVQLAEFQDGAGSVDPDDFVLFEVQLDGAGYSKVLEIIGTGANAFFAEDTDFNGSADGAQLNSTALSFTKPIAGTGANLDLRVSIKVNADDEDIGIDNIRITGM